MPIEIPAIDARRWEDLRSELLARIPSHTPEWTNFNASDPGVTLLELFAFLGESILYRTNLIPERNRLAFLKLLGLPLHPGAPARALVTFSRARATTTVTTLGAGLELQAGKLAFHLDAGLDVLPVESHVCYKAAERVGKGVEEAYVRLYKTFLKDRQPALTLYRTTPLGEAGVPLGGSEAIDQAVWIALLVPQGGDAEKLRPAIAGRVLNLGLAPTPTTDGRDLAPHGSVAAETLPGIKVDICSRSSIAGVRGPRFVPLGERRGCLRETDVVGFVLPGKDDLEPWQPVEVLEDGVGDAPPALTDSGQQTRLLVWLRVSPVGGANVRLRWLGINAAMASQGDRVYGEQLGVGNGEPGQQWTAASRPIVPGSLRLWAGEREWSVVDDVESAPREGAPGSEVAQVDWEAGVVRCGSGLAGARPARGAPVKIAYEVSAGASGNLGAGAIRQHSGPPEIKIDNPIPTWGGAAAETVADGERQVARWLQHRDRLVTVGDFQTLVRRTPGVAIARVEVLPAYHPLTGNTRPGDAAGCVTILVVPPPSTPGEPPRPTDAMLETICAWLEPRRLVTTELLLRGPEYVPIVVSVGVEVAARGVGRGAAEVLAAVREALLAALAPTPGSRGDGWPLTRTVRDAELFVIVASVPGVLAVREVLVADRHGHTGKVPLTGLQLPWLAAVSVVEGVPVQLSALVPVEAPATKTSSVVTLPVPIVPDECR